MNDILIVAANEEQARKWMYDQPGSHEHYRFASYPNQLSLYSGKSKVTLVVLGAPRYRPAEFLEQIERLQAEGMRVLDPNKVLPS